MVLLNKMIDFIAMPFVYIIGVSVFFLVAIGWGAKTFVCFIANNIWEGLFALEEMMFNCKLKKQYSKFLDIISSVAD